MRSLHVPGAALGVLAGSREEHAVFGVASVETNAPVTRETRFQIGSLTKTYTAGFAFVVLTNAEPGGKLLAQAALDAALSEYPGTAQLAGRVGMMTAVLAPAGKAASAKAPARPGDYVGS